MSVGAFIHLPLSLTHKHLMKCTKPCSGCRGHSSEPDGYGPYSHETRLGRGETKKKKKTGQTTRVASEGDEDGLGWKEEIHLDQEVRKHPLQAGGIGTETRRTRRNWPRKAARDGPSRGSEEGKGLMGVCTSQSLNSLNGCLGWKVLRWGGDMMFGLQFEASLATGWSMTWN